MHFPGVCTQRVPYSEEKLGYLMSAGFQLGSCSEPGVLLGGEVQTPSTGFNFTCLSL